MLTKNERNRLLAERLSAAKAAVWDAEASLAEAQARHTYWYERARAETETDGAESTISPATGEGGSKVRAQTP